MQVKEQRNTCFLLCSCCGNNVKHLLLGLLDTGDTGIFVKRKSLKGIDHQVEKVNLRVKGRYSQTQLKEIAIFDIKLPDLCGGHQATVCVYLEENSIGYHDIVLKIQFIKQLGLIFDFQK